MSVVFDRAVPFYDRTRGFPPATARAIAALAREQTSLRPGSRVLEIGVGTGRIALPLARDNRYRYIGVDLSRAMMAELRRKQTDESIVLLQADAARLPLGDAVVDGVVAVHVFHLIEHWAAAMDETRRVLRPGGVLLAGHTRYAETSPVRELRRRLDDWAGGGARRREAGLLDWNAVTRELEARFGPAREASTPPWSTATTPRQVIDAYEARIWSATWLIGDDALREAAARARQWAVERWGSLDAPLSEEQSFVWTIFTR